MDFLLKGAELICLEKEKIVTGDLLISGTEIVGLGREIDPPQGELEIIDCSGLQVFPGFFDMHVHFREPGQTHKEDIKSGLQAAAAGGFTGVAAMANTSPVVDGPSLVETLLNKGKEYGGPEYHQIAAATRNLQGKEFADISGLLSAGAIAISDDGQPIQDSGFLKDLLQHSKEKGFLYIEHCEDKKYEPENPLSEIQMVYRDIDCLTQTGGRLHIAHISCGKSLELVVEGKKQGLNLTCEVTPHHLFLDQGVIKKMGTNARMSPPLRTPEDAAVLREGLKKGLIDCIATDHAPHSPGEKEKSYNQAPRGVVGLETAVGTVWKELFHGEGLSPLLLGKLFATNPRRILNLSPIDIRQGGRADLTVIDPEKEWRVRAEDFYSRGKNSPFTGKALRGKPALVFKNGEKIMENGRVLIPAGRN